MDTVLETIRVFELTLDSVVDNATLEEVRERLSAVIDRLDERLDLQLIDERRSEPTISHHQLTHELRSDGLI